MDERSLQWKNEMRERTWDRVDSTDLALVGNGKNNIKQSFVSRFRQKQLLKWVRR